MGMEKIDVVCQGVSSIMRIQVQIPSSQVKAGRNDSYLQSDLSMGCDDRGEPGNTWLTAQLIYPSW